MPSLAGGVAGAALRSGISRAAIGFGTGSFPVEFMASIADSLAESGVNLKDPKAIEAVKVITDKLSSFLKSKGFEEVQTETYDEDLHEVISVVTTGKEEIVDVVSKGWKLNGQVVKYPKVILSK